MDSMCGPLITCLLYRFNFNHVNVIVSMKQKLWLACFYTGFFHQGENAIYSKVVMFSHLCLMTDNTVRERGTLFFF